MTRVSSLVKLKDKLNYFIFIKYLGHNSTEDKRSIIKKWRRKRKRKKILLNYVNSKHPSKKHSMDLREIKGEK